MSNSPLVNKQLWCCWSVRLPAGPFVRPQPDEPVSVEWHCRTLWQRCQESVRACARVSTIFLSETESTRARERWRRTTGREETEVTAEVTTMSRTRALWLTLTLSEGCLTLAPLSQWLILCAATCMCVLLIDWWEPWAHRLDVRLLLFLSSVTFFFLHLVLNLLGTPLLAPLIQLAKASSDSNTSWNFETMSVVMGDQRTITKAFLTEGHADLCYNCVLSAVFWITWWK